MAEKPQANRATRRSGKRAKGDPITFQFGGASYTAAHPDDWPLPVLGQLNRGEIEEALAVIMDEENAAQFMATSPTVGDANEFFDVLKAAARSGN